MLREIRPVKQYEDEDFRRWFTDEFWDLYVWIDENDNITSFQLTYGKPDREHALTWSKKRGFQHTKIDDGESIASAHMTPLLVKDGLFDKDAIAVRFKSTSSEIDKKVADFVEKKIHETTL